MAGRWQDVDDANRRILSDHEIVDANDDQVADAVRSHIADRHGWSSIRRLRYCHLPPRSRDRNATRQKNRQSPAYLTRKRPGPGIDFHFLIWRPGEQRGARTDQKIVCFRWRRREEWGSARNAPDNGGASGIRAKRMPEF